MPQSLKQGAPITRDALACEGTNTRNINVNCGQEIALCLLLSFND